MNTGKMAAVLALALAGAASVASAQDATRLPGDPPRWYVPNVTPQDRYNTSVKEAAAALKEALDECRATASADCVRAAREQHRSDVAAATARLAQERVARAS
jgi:hypothetical protein